MELGRLLCRSRLATLLAHNHYSCGGSSSPMTSRTMTAYCEQCEAQRQAVDLQQITMRNGRPATRGTCPVCGSHLFKIGSLETILRLEAERRERPRSN